MSSSTSSGSVGVMVDKEIDPIRYVDIDSIGAPVDEEIVSIEVTRPIFNRNDYVLITRELNKYICPTHNVNHPHYTHGCQPLAMPKSHWDDEFIEATNGEYIRSEPGLDSVPLAVTMDCKIHRSEPHIHQDFRWQL